MIHKAIKLHLSAIKKNTATFFFVFGNIANLNWTTRNFKISSINCWTNTVMTTTNKRIKCLLIQIGMILLLYYD